MMRHAMPLVPTRPLVPSRDARRSRAAVALAVMAGMGAWWSFVPAAVAQGPTPPSYNPATRPVARPPAKQRPPHNGTSSSPGSGSTSSGQGTSWGEAAPGVEGSDSELSDYAKETNVALHSIAPGNASLDVAFPGGGARGLEGAAGARMILPANMGLSVALLVGLDKEAKKNGYGGAVKIQRFLPTSTRAFPYAWVGFNAGKNGGEGNKDADDFEAGAGLGFGVEVFLLKEISTSAEIGVASRVMPGDAFRLATGTSQIALHYFFGE